MSNLTVLVGAGEGGGVGSMVGSCKNLTYRTPLSLQVHNRNLCHRILEARKMEVITFVGARLGAAVGRDVGWE